MQQSRTAIDVAGLAPGMYLYKIVEDGAVKDKGKLIKN
ncbi:MAG: T9SS type A sorting domain-containing protein [Taibaiella sp.]|nr:T9SS type A sorting domain-containing protein [Taibaiella sp.]